MSKYDGMTDREIDALVAERLMGWHVKEGKFRPGLLVKQTPDSGFEYAPRFTFDDNAARLVRGWIAELGMDRGFMVAIRSSVKLVGDSLTSGFEFMQATPRQQAIAALEALDETNTEGATRDVRVKGK